ncbi:MAG: hypothetical protein MJD61_04415 [Proteobacteria bacterium]|nr:hypothetical protein [Pseudomonadota bacterium]
MQPSTRRFKQLVARKAEQRRERVAGAFLADPRDGPAAASDDAGVSDDLAELLAQQVLVAATSGGYVVQDALNADVDEDAGGPFVETGSRAQFARHTERDDASDSEAEPAPFPTAMSEPPEANED